MNRQDFLKNTFLTSAGVLFGISAIVSCKKEGETLSIESASPLKKDPKTSNIERGITFLVVDDIVFGESEKFNEKFGTNKIIKCQLLKKIKTSISDLIPNQRNGISSEDGYLKSRFGRKKSIITRKDKLSYGSKDYHITDFSNKKVLIEIPINSSGMPLDNLNIKLIESEQMGLALPNGAINFINNNKRERKW